MFLIQFFNALQFSMTLFLLAVGLTIIFGLMKIVNLLDLKMLVENLKKNKGRNIEKNL